MHISVLEIKKTAYEGNAKEVILPADDGEITVLDFHQPFLCALRSGYITIKDKPDNIRLKIRYGLAKMIRNDLVINIETYA